MRNRANPVHRFHKLGDRRFRIGLKLVSWRLACPPLPRVAFHSNPRGRYGQETESEEGEEGKSQEVIKTAPPKAGPN